jgi:phytoene dehydrogenase-like protein
MDTVLPGLEQHNVYVSDNYRKNIEAVFHGSGVAPEPSFYIHSPARADKSAAPEGQDSVSVIVPVGHLGHGSVEAWRQGDMEAWKRGGMEAGRHGGMEAWRRGGMETWRHKSVEAWRQGSREAWIGKR